MQDHSTETAYAIVFSVPRSRQLTGPGRLPVGLTTLVYRNAKYPMSERLENQEVRVYRHGGWDGRYIPDKICETAGEAVNYLYDRWDALVAVPADVAREILPGPLRFAELG